MVCCEISVGNADFAICRNLVIVIRHPFDRFIDDDISLYIALLSGTGFPFWTSKSSLQGAQKSWSYKELGTVGSVELSMEHQFSSWSSVICKSPSTDSDRGMLMFGISPSS